MISSSWWDFFVGRQWRGRPYLISPLGDMVASGGIVGLAIVMWFLVVVLRRARVNLRASGRFVRAACFAALIAMVGIGVHSLVDFGLHRMANAMIFASLIVIATCNVNTARNRQSEDV